MMSNGVNFVLACLPVFLAACGGGGGGTDQAARDLNDTVIFDDSNSDPNTTTSLDITAFGLDRGNNSLFLESGQLVNGDTVTGSTRLAGPVTIVDGGDDFITTSSGKAIARPGGTSGADYIFTAGNSSFLSVVGLVSASIPPSGTAAYTGSADVFVNDGATPLRLTGMSAVANFSTNRVTITINNGAKNVVISDAAIAGSNFTGGTLSANGFSSTPSGLTAPTHSGAFFGPNATEMGGVLILDDTGNGNPFSVSGVYSSN